MNDSKIFGIPASFMDSYNHRACEIVERHRKLLSVPQIELMLSEELQRFRGWYPTVPPGTPVLIASERWSLSSVVWDTPPINPAPLSTEKGHAEHLGAVIVNVEGWMQCDLWACRQCEEVATSLGTSVFGGPLEVICKGIAEAKSPAQILERVPVALVAAARLATLRFYN